MATINVNSQSTLSAALTGSDLSPNIIVTGSFTMTAGITMRTGMTASISSDAGGPYTITRGSGATAALITVPSADSLTLANIIIDGNKAAVTASNALIYNNGGRVVVDKDTILSNNKCTGSTTPGGGIYNAAGTVELHPGAVITGNEAYYGGGIYNKGAIIIYGGSISKNASTSTGGGGVRNDGTLTMYAGNIDGNTGLQQGGGVLNNTNGAFELYGGNINSNLGTQQGGGIFNRGMLNMYSGTVNQNVSGPGANGQGGGLYTIGSFIMTGGEFAGNEAGAAGGIFIHPSSIINYIGGDSLIEGNIATVYSGGGINLW
jgi:hypothetical protein